MTALFSSLKLREVTLKNRIGMPPMCQYSAQNGIASDWHLVHYGSHAIGGAGLIILEATAVAPEGRISAGDLGIWSDDQIAPLSRITDFNLQQGCVTAVQLAHAGRKGSVQLGWQEQKKLDHRDGGWSVIGPSPLQFDANYALPHEMMANEIHAVVAQFGAAAERALAAGFQALEIHAAHGYLIHQFLSPLSNLRQDSYGGSFENRTRLAREVISAVRRVWPERLPLLLRLSATDWKEAGWDVEQTIALCRTVKQLGVDLVDVSSGGLVPNVTVLAAPGFQTGFAERIRREAGVPTSAVGLITSAQQAEHILQTGQADMVLIGRALLRNPYWPLDAATALGELSDWPRQYLRAAPEKSRARVVMPAN